MGLRHADAGHSEARKENRAEHFAACSYGRGAFRGTPITARDGREFLPAEMRRKPNFRQSGNASPQRARTTYPASISPAQDGTHDSEPGTLRLPGGGTSSCTAACGSSRL